VITPAPSDGATVTSAPSQGENPVVTSSPETSATQTQEPSPQESPSSAGPTESSTATSSSETPSPTQTTTPEATPTTTTVPSTPTVTSIQEKIDTATATVANTIIPTNVATETSVVTAVTEATTAITAAQESLATATTLVQAADSATALIAPAAATVETATSTVAAAVTVVEDKTAVVAVATTEVATAQAAVEEVTTPGLKVEVYAAHGQNASPVLNNNTPLIHTTTDTDGINEQWGSGPIAGSYRTEDTIVKYTGTWTPSVEVSHVYAPADDGVKLYLNGQLVINDWYDKGGGGSIAATAISAGTSKEFELWYYENGGGAAVWFYRHNPQTGWAIAPGSEFTQSSATPEQQAALDTAQAQLRKT